MIRYDFTICGLQIRLDTPQSLNPEMDACIFRRPPQTPHVHVTLHAVDTLPPPEGTVCPSNREYPVWQAGSTVRRVCWDRFRPVPHSMAVYDLTAPDRVACYIRQEDWTWTTREKYLWNVIQLRDLLLHHRAMIFHASYIDYAGSGIVFTAPSQTGKSTQARLWQEYKGAEIRNGDKAGIYLGDSPLVCGVPFSGTSGICRDVSLPLKAVVVLSQAPENTVRRMKPIEAVQALCPNLFADQAIPEEWQLAMGLLLDLVEQVPIYALACTPDVRAVETLHQAIFPEMKEHP